MNNPNPPRLFEHVLALLLSSRDRDTIAGDLHETYAEEKLPQLGSTRANLWYARQVLSFLPQRLLAVAWQRQALAFLCAFTALSGIWLGVMDFLLNHPGYAWRELIAGTIVMQALLTLLAVCLRRSARLRPVVLCGCAAILYLAGRAFYGVLHTPHFEGYIVLIAMALGVQALLTVAVLLRPAPLGPFQPGNL